MSGPGAAVTVVIPVWDDYVEFLAEAVESVRRNAPQAPIVVVDNASSTPVPELEGCEVVRSPRRLSVGRGAKPGPRAGRHRVRRLPRRRRHAARGDPGVPARADRRRRGPGGLRDARSSTGRPASDTATPRRFVPRLARWPRAFALADSIWSLLPIQGCAILRTDQVREAGGYADDASCGEDWVLAVSLAWRGRVEVSAAARPLLPLHPGVARGAGRGPPAELRGERAPRPRADATRPRGARLGARPAAGDRRPPARRDPPGEAGLPGRAQARDRAPLEHPLNFGFILV